MTADNIFSLGDGDHGECGGVTTTLLDYNGWQVAVISGEIDPHASNTLYAKLLHQPGKEAGWYSRSLRMQGLFGLTSRSQ